MTLPAILEQQGFDVMVAASVPEALELISHRELLFFLVKRNIKVRYRQTSLGWGWAVLQPVATMAILTFVFGRLIGPHPAVEAGARTQWKSGQSTFAVNLSRYASNHAPAPVNEGAAADDRWFGTASAAPETKQG